MKVTIQQKIAMAALGSATVLFLACGSGTVTDPESSDNAAKVTIMQFELDNPLKNQTIIDSMIEVCAKDTLHVICTESGDIKVPSSSSTDGSSSAVAASSSGAAVASSSSTAVVASSSGAAPTISSSSAKASSSSAAVVSSSGTAPSSSSAAISSSSVQTGTTITITKGSPVTLEKDVVYDASHSCSALMAFANNVQPGTIAVTIGTTSVSGSYYASATPPSSTFTLVSTTAGTTADCQ